jgi:hypothetical protein
MTVTGARSLKPGCEVGEEEALRGGVKPEDLVYLEAA